MNSNVLTVNAFTAANYLQTGATAGLKCASSSTYLLSDYIPSSLLLTLSNYTTEWVAGGAFAVQFIGSTSRFTVDGNGVATRGFIGNTAVAQFNDNTSQFTVVSRLSPTSLSLYIDTVLRAFTSTDVTGAVYPTIPFPAFAVSIQGNATFPTVGLRMTHNMIASSFTAQQVLDYSTAVNTLMAALGANVY